MKRSIKIFSFRNSYAYITFQIFDRNHIPSCTSAGSVLQLWKVSFKSNEPLCLQAHLSIQNVFQSISLIISPSKFWIATIFLHAHLQVMHYNCVKFHKNPISCLGGVALTRYMPSLVCETTARQLAKGEWKFRVASKIHFILAGMASNS